MWGMVWTRYFLGQSTEDGTMPLLEAAFGSSTENGDFYEPSLRMNTIGPVQKYDLSKETHTAAPPADDDDQNNSNSNSNSNNSARDELWKASDEACGQFLLPSE